MKSRSIEIVGVLKREILYACNEKKIFASLRDPHKNFGFGLLFSFWDARCAASAAAAGYSARVGQKEHQFALVPENTPFIYRGGSAALRG
jgi:hypothetical protein